jgi:hypothetical protein
MKEGAFAAPFAIKPRESRSESQSVIADFANERRAEPLWSSRSFVQPRTHSPRRRKMLQCPLGACPPTSRQSLNFCRPMAATRDVLYRSRNLWNACLLPPNVEGLGPSCPIGFYDQQVAAGIEVTINECVRGKKFLDLSWRFKSLHLPLSTQRRTMQVLGPIVGYLLWRSSAFGRSWRRATP